ncbi:hypothetical protein DFQ30_002132, partial [Apophysomyces sp. BC1015]
MSQPAVSSSEHTFLTSNPCTLQDSARLLLDPLLSAATGEFLQPQGLLSPVPAIGTNDGIDCETLRELLDSASPQEHFTTTFNDPLGYNNASSSSDRETSHNPSLNFHTIPSEQSTPLLSGTNPLKCYDCNQDFKCLPNLKRHYNSQRHIRATGNRSRQQLTGFLCEKCPRRYSRKDAR